jgi:hypothetical protein
MTLEQLYILFQNIKTVDDKIEFLRSIQEKNLYYNINYEGLIAAWTTMQQSSYGESK